jgi:hypothetical protein
MTVLNRDFEPKDYTVAVRKRGDTQAKPCRWELYRAGRSTPVLKSETDFDWMTAASRDGKAALKMAIVSSSNGAVTSYASSLAAATTGRIGIRVNSPTVQCEALPLEQRPAREQIIAARIVPWMGKTKGAAANHVGGIRHGPYAGRNSGGSGGRSAAVGECWSGFVKWSIKKNFPGSFTHHCQNISI